MVKEQLVNIFGPEMGNALSLEIKDWAQDIRVSIPLDVNGLGYTLPMACVRPLGICGTESSFSGQRSRCIN